MPSPIIARAAADAAQEVTERVNRFIRITEPRTGFRLLNPTAALRAINNRQIVPFRSENGSIQFLRSAFMPNDGNIVATYTNHNMEETSNPSRYVYREPISLDDPNLRVSYRDSDGDHINVPISEELLRRGETELRAKIGNGEAESGETMVYRSMSPTEVRDILSGQDSEPIFMTRFSQGLFTGSNRILVSTPRNPMDVQFGGTHVNPTEIIHNPFSTVSYYRTDGSRYDGPINAEQINSFRAKENSISPEQRILRDLFNMDSVPIEETTTTTSERAELTDLWRRLRDDSRFRTRFGDRGLHVLTDEQRAEAIARIREWNLAHPDDLVSAAHIPGFAQGALTPRWDDEVQWFSRFGQDGQEYRDTKYSPREVYTRINDFIGDLSSGAVVGPNQSVSTDAYPMLLSSAISHYGTTPGKVSVHPLTTTNKTNTFGDTAVYFDDVFNNSMKEQFPVLEEIENWIRRRHQDPNTPPLSLELRNNLNSIVEPIYNRKAQHLIDVYKRKYNKLGEHNPEILKNINNFSIVPSLNSVSNLTINGKVPVIIRYPELLFEKLKQGGKVNPYK